MKYLLVTLFVTLLGVPALLGQSVEERLAKLEREVRELRTENAQLRQQMEGGASAAAATPAPPAPPQPQAAAQEIRPAGKESKLLVGGFIHAQAESGDRPDTRFGDENDRVFLRRARVNVQGSFPEHFDFKAEMELGGNSLGSATGLRLQATDVYTQWTRHPFAQVRIGQFKTPYGYEQIFSDTKLLAVERSLMSDRITIGRGLGVQLAGDMGPVSYAAGAFNGNGTNVTINDDEGFLAVARVSATPWKRGGNDRWSIGVNGYRGEDRSAPVAPELGFSGNAFAGTRRAWGADSQLIAGKLELWTEILRARFDPASGETRDLKGWYAAGGWLLTKRIQAVAMYDTLDAPLDDVRTWTVGANYFIKGHDLKLQLNLMHTDDDQTRVTARLQTLF
jgi:phosphate-selective porin OprO/OprP